MTSSDWVTVNLIECNDSDLVINVASAGFYFSFPFFQLDRSRKKEKLSLNLGNNKLSVGLVSPRGHSDSRMMTRTSDLSPRPRKTSQVSKTSMTEVKVENGKRIERRTESIIEDGKENKLIFENDKLGNC